MVKLYLHLQNDGTNPNIDTISLASDVVDDTSPQLGGNLNKTLT